MTAAQLRHPSGDEMALTLTLWREGGPAAHAPLAAKRLDWREGKLGEIPTLALMELVAGAKKGAYRLRGEWRLREAPADAPPALTEELGAVQILPPPPTSIERSHSRRVALQLLYEIDSAGRAAETAIAHSENYARLSPRQRGSVRQFVRGVLSEREQLDRVIQQYAPEFPLSQLAIVDRNILRLALFELIHSGRPQGVIIDEAVSLAVVFGAEGSISFVNGVLGSVADDRAEERADEERAQERAESAEDPAIESAPAGATGA